MIGPVIPRWADHARPAARMIWAMTKGQRIEVQKEQAVLRWQLVSGLHFVQQ